MFSGCSRPNALHRRNASQASTQPTIHANVIEGDARRLPELIPPAWHRRVGSVVCGIPLVLLPFAEQRRFLDAIEAVAPGRGFLHFSYCATSPLPARRHRLTARREAWTPLNFPPASVWRYTPKA